MTELCGPAWGNPGRYYSPKESSVNPPHLELLHCQDWSELEGCWDSLKAWQSFSLSYLWIMWLFNSWRGVGFQLYIFSCSKGECFTSRIVVLENYKLPQYLGFSRLSTVFISFCQIALNIHTFLEILSSKKALWLNIISFWNVKA